MELKEYRDLLEQRGLSVKKSDLLQKTFENQKLFKKIEPNVFKPAFKLKHAKNVTHRLLNHWTNLGLIDDKRNDKKTWRTFDFIELIWIEIILVLRSFGLSNDAILNTKKYLFELKNENEDIYHFEYYISLSIAKIINVHLLVLPDGLCTLLDDYEFRDFVALAKASVHYIHVDVNDIVNKLFQREKISPLIAKSDIQITAKEHSVLQRIKEKNYNKIEIILKNGDIERINCTKTLSDIKNQKIIDLIQEHQFQSINIEIENGKTININKIEKFKP